MMGSSKDWNFLLILCTILYQSLQGALGEEFLCACAEVPSCNVNLTTCSSEVGCYSISRYDHDKVEKGCLGFGLPGCLPIPGYVCCSSVNFCNAALNPAAPSGPTQSTTEGNETVTPASHGGIRTFHIAIYAVLAVGIVFMAIVSILLGYRHHKNKTQPATSQQSSTQDLPTVLNADAGSMSTDMLPCTPGSTMLTDPASTQSSRSVDSFLQGDSLYGSSSGTGYPYLIQRTVGRELTWKNKIGAGKFGEVWRCYWHKQNKHIAVKCSKSRSEGEWGREVQIYESSMTRHSNILGFIAADLCDRDGVTQMLILTEYHRRGSLHSYLENEELTMDSFLRLAGSVANGLLHLHSIVHGSTGTKPGMAHRDVKSKNILVKDNGEACICDLGLGVIYDPSKVKKIPFEVKRVMVGTRRYMPPEVLQGTINKYSFESFKLADTYSFSLVLWAIARRCNYLGVEGGADTYLEPFGEMVGDNPTYPEMIEVAINQKQRPHIPSGWYDHRIMKEIGRICRTCWKEKPSSRLTMSRVAKNITRLSVAFDMKEGDEESDSGCGDDAAAWNTHQFRHQPQNAEVLTVSTRIEMDTPEQSGLSRRMPAPSLAEGNCAPATGGEGTPRAPLLLSSSSPQQHEPGDQQTWQHEQQQPQQQQPPQQPLEQFQGQEQPVTGEQQQERSSVSLGMSARHARLLSGRVSGPTDV
ncbi:bone morphogenetic protein receptor type-1B-like isoform X2 [Sycon ciliatum]|uniref:bone morphogenetic protein receptor type-1B-like isoform X2 n=1 Tax=Sycon ciliatum TaxID=27933 RepID=UPI0031F66266